MQEIESIIEGAKVQNFLHSSTYHYNIISSQMKISCGHSSGMDDHPYTVVPRCNPKYHLNKDLYHILIITNI